MSAVQTINGVADANATPQVATIKLSHAPEPYALLLNMTATFGTVGATNGVTMTIQVSPDNTNWTTHPTSMTIAGVASTTISQSVQISLQPGDISKLVAGTIQYVKVSIANADTVNTVDVSLISDIKSTQ